MPITKLEQMFDALKSKTKKRLVAAFANDSHTIGAISAAIDKGIVEATLVGDETTIKKVCTENNFDFKKFKIVQEADEWKATQKAIELINKGEGDVLMKGLVTTDKYMRAILDKEKGLMSGPKAILSHVTVIETPKYHKLLVVGDVAIIPAPDLPQKIAITNYLIQTAHALQIENPKVALLAATEQMSLGMPACVDAAIISKMSDRGQIKGAIVEGPLALDVCVDKESCEIKKIKSPVGGDADCILFPNIESGNVFFKTNTKLCGGELGAVVFGAKVPCILTSRGDSEKTKLFSIALGAMLVK
ncbi:MAG TPA: phosphate acyltransferase [Bacteroidales bacterium]|nr:phosphate acyltransferase [Bacteroidales bacterium]HQI44608.1 phosphate acyltransferase [Bacteroidales bacterium]